MVVFLVRSPIIKAMVILISTERIEQYESSKKEKENNSKECSCATTICITKVTQIYNFDTISE